MNVRVFVAVLLMIGSSAAAQSVPVETFVQDRVEQLRAGGGLEIGDVDVAAVLLLPEFYERREFAPAWPTPERARRMLDRARAAYDEGLDPDDYHVPYLATGIAAWSDGTLDNAGRADLDLVLTDALLRLVYHLLFGKVDVTSLDPNWNLARELGDRDPVIMLESILGADSLAEYLREALAPPEAYDRLRAALVHYRAIAAAGGWPTVPAGPTLKPGMRDPRVATLRTRLRISGDLEGPVAEDPERFDAALETAVEGYQSRHGLDADGVVGKRTIEALAVPVEDRIGQIRVTLERARWILRNLPDEFVLVNIARFRMWFNQGGPDPWTARVQVGKPYRKTPVFRADMKYLVFNPTWTVPPTILRKDVVPAIKKDPSYLQRKNMAVLDRSGKKIDPATIDWAAVDPARFPYVIRQEPGPNNALGRVKFIFPNEHFVFLHDTASRTLFDRAERTFSSGCIRVEDPLEFARLLLEDQDGWSAEKIAEVIDGGKTTTVHLSRPLPVLLLYWTMTAEGDTPVGFLHDVYDRDSAVLEGLDDDFVFSAPSDRPDYLRR